MSKTTTGPGKGATCTQDTATAKNEYVTVSLPLLTSTLADIDAFAESLQPKTISREALLRILIVTGLACWKSEEGEGELTDIHSA